MFDIRTAGPYEWRAAYKWLDEDEGCATMYVWTKEEDEAVARREVEYSLNASGCPYEIVQVKLVNIDRNWEGKR